MTSYQRLSESRKSRVLAIHYNRAKGLERMLRGLCDLRSDAYTISMLATPFKARDFAELSEVVKMLEDCEALLNSEHIRPADKEAFTEVFESIRTIFKTDIGII